MKDSGVEWIGDIPEDWELRRLKLTVDLINDKTEYNGQTYIGLENIESGCGKYLETENQTIDGVSNSFSTGDILFGKLRPYLAKCIIAPCDGLCSSELLVIRNFKGNQQFLFWTLLSHWFINIVDASTYGAKMPRASWNFIRDLKICYPSRPGQNRIASFLDTKCSLIDSTIQKEREVITKLKEYRQAVITEAVTKGIRAGVPMKDSGVEWIGEIPEGWDVQKIKSYYSIVNGSTPKSDKSEYWGGDIIWITPAEMSPSIVEIYDSKRTITEDGLQSCGTTLLPMNSIILSTRAPIGQVCIAGTSLCTNQGCKSLVMRAEFNYKYSYYYLSSQTVTLNMLGRGTTFMELSSYDLANYPLPIPPLPEQQDIVDYLDAKCSAIDATIQKRELAIEKLTAYKQSLIYECVTGKREVLA